MRQLKHSFAQNRVEGNCVLQGYYALSSGHFLPTFRDNLSGPIFKGPDRVSQNVGKKLPLLAA